ncbi:MAG: ATP-binding protein [Lachnospiraceae bacterium]|nr:ATP-binding protein [Lachnospiraceae bacterium]
MNQVGIAKVKGREIVIGGNSRVAAAVKVLSKYGLITFARQMKFKSTEYTVCFFKPIAEMRSMYNLGNELLMVCCPDGMNDFKSRTKDFIDYMLITNTEFKNRLDKVTCFLVDGDMDVAQKVKVDRIENPDTRLIVPFSLDELEKGFSENDLSNRLREFLYEKDLFGIAVPLRDDTLFFGMDRTNIISELFARYKQGEEGGLFGLRRIGKTSILNLLKLRIAESDGVAVYFDCSSSHHFRWNEFLMYIVSTISEEYSVEKNENGSVMFISECKIDVTEERYSERNAVKSFIQDVKTMYALLGNKRILIILDEIEGISYTTSPSKWWREEDDALFFWQAIRSLIQMNSDYLSFVVAGVNPMCVETQSINKFDNPIFGMFSPIYTSLFGYDDIKNMISSIGGRLGLYFEDAVYVKMMEDYGGHPFLIRQVCSRINNELNANKVARPVTISNYNYMLKCDEYKQGMTSVIEQILGVIENYYPNEFQLLKTLALDGRSAFKKEIALGEKGIQHLIGYGIVEKAEGEYFIRIKSIEEYIKSKFIYDATLDEQKDKRARINIRRDTIEEKLRVIILFSYQSKYGKKAKEQLISIAEKTTTDKTQKTKMLNAPSLKKMLEELYLSQLKDIIDKEWKSFAAIFPDKSKFEAYMDILNRSRSVGAHARNVSNEEEVMYSIAFDFFEKALEEY